MLIRAATLDDRQAWLELAHESDYLVGGLVPDISTFYHGFGDYMERKIVRHEAFIAVDRVSSRCLGAVAFSKTNNRITFLGIAGSADFRSVGSKLVQIALDRLDNTKEIAVNVLKTDSELIKQEHDLYELFGFLKSGDELVEAGIPAYVMKRLPSA